MFFQRFVDYLDLPSPPIHAMSQRSWTAHFAGLPYDQGTQEIVPGKEPSGASIEVDGYLGEAFVYLQSQGTEISVIAMAFKLEEIVVKRAIFLLKMHHVCTYLQRSDLCALLFIQTLIKIKSNLTTFESNPNQNQIKFDSNLIQI